MKLGMGLVAGLGMGVVGLVGGFSTTGTMPPAPRADQAAGNYPNITVQDARLRNFIVISDVSVSGGELMKVNVALRLDYTGDATSSVQYRFTFLDARGTPLASQSGWQLMDLPPRVQRFMTGVALDKGAEDWRLEIRSAQGGIH